MQKLIKRSDLKKHVFQQVDICVILLLPFLYIISRIILTNYLYFVLSNDFIFCIKTGASHP